MLERNGIVVLKWILFVGNMFLWLFGVGVLVFALWLFFDTGNADRPEKLDQHLRFLSPELSYYYAAVYLLIGAGLIILVCGFFGWLGAYRESSCMLMTYACIMGIILAVHIIAAIIAYAYRFEIQKAVAVSIQDVVQSQYGDGNYNRESEIIDYLQRRFNCCGGIEYEDWVSSKWKTNLETENQIDEVVPTSCCFGASAQGLVCPTYSSVLGGRNPYLHQTGCATKIKRRFLDYIIAITAGGLSIAILELLAVVLTVVMIKKLNAEAKRIY